MNDVSVSKPRVKSFFQTAVFVLLSVLVVSFLVSSLLDADSLAGGDGVAVIPVKGVITIDAASGFLDSSVASSSRIVSLIESADKDDSYKAIVLDINSPGGAPVASNEIVIAVKKASKPVVALIRETGASGAYWVASAADHVVANSLSITGSVGVIGSYVEFAEFLEEYNVTYRRLVVGEYKDLGSPFRELSRSEEDVLQSKLNRMGEIFLSDVVSNRNLSDEHKEVVSTAVFFLGVEAVEVGLVDELGGFDEVSDYLLDVHGLEAKYKRLSVRTGFFEALSSFGSSHGYWVGKGLSDSVFSSSRGGGDLR